MDWQTTSCSPEWQWVISMFQQSITSDCSVVLHSHEHSLRQTANVHMEINQLHKHCKKRVILPPGFSKWKLTSMNCCKVTLILKKKYLYNLYIVSYLQAQASIFCASGAISSRVCVVLLIFLFPLIKALYYVIIYLIVNLCDNNNSLCFSLDLTELKPD